MISNKRKHRRFSATAFLDMPVVLSPLPPYFGHSVKGQLIDLSAGGLAFVIDEIIPQKSKLDLELKFPDGSIIHCIIEVKHVLPREKKFLHGIEFLTLPSYLAQKIDKLSNDYIDCETRIQEKAAEICRSDCSFFNLCQKPQRREPPIFDVNTALELAFNSLKDSSLEVRQP